jgi:uncharacterized membrane protein YdjX (TVP38/TMEM64 family)
VAAISTVSILSGSSWGVKLNSAYSIGVTALSVAAVFSYNQSRTLLWSWVVFAEEKIEKLWKSVVPHSHAGFVTIIQQGDVPVELDELADNDASFVQ